MNFLVKLYRTIIALSLKTLGNQYDLCYVTRINNSLDRCENLPIFAIGFTNKSVGNWKFLKIFVE